MEHKKKDPVSIIKIVTAEKIKTENIGFLVAPDIARTKSKIDGFNLNIIAIGRRGLGTCTLINALFDCPLVDKSRKNKIVTTKNEIYENDICLKISVTTYHDDDCDDILGYILEQNMKYYEEEQCVYRKKDIVDARIHLCLYLLPTYQINEEEIQNIKRLSEIVNLVPIISKADSFTKPELQEQKENIRKIISKHKIDCFVPEFDGEEDCEYIQEAKTTIDAYPLAVFASTEEFEFNGQKRKGRQYPWCFIDIEDESFSDFKKLRRLIIQNHLEDLIYVTDTKFYNNFRKLIIEQEAKNQQLKINKFKRIKNEMDKTHNERHISRMKNLEFEIINLQSNPREKKTLKIERKKDSFNK